MLFNKFYNKKIIKGTLTAIDPIHIGSSNNEGLDPTQVDNLVLKDAEEKPIIPGSALKGVIRSNFEAVLRSIDEKDACNPFDDYDERCLTNARVKQIAEMRDKTDEEKAEILYKESCIVCRLFGGKGVASKLQFKDCCFIGRKCVYEYRDGVGIDRETGSVKNGMKYDFEIVPKGAKFAFYMTAENLDAEQEKYLVYILDLLKSGELAVGGKTSRGLGRIKLDNNIEIKSITLDALREKLGL